MSFTDNTAKPTQQPTFQELRDRVVSAQQLAEAASDQTYDVTLAIAALENAFSDYQEMSRNADENNLTYLINRYFIHKQRLQTEKAPHSQTMADLFADNLPR